jgi:crotonobetainyl-CoA:carnitine CoA-transferase CaiB-like acyl-CoA transferase
VDGTPVLDGIRVLDVSRYIAGPYCAGLLAQLGADVVRVEPVEGAEDRTLAPLGPDAPGGLFLQANRGKRGITLCLGDAAAAGVLRRLVARSDVIVANLPPAALNRLGLDYASVRTIRPDAILTTVSAFGSEGPWRDRVGFDGVAQAMCGAAYLSGSPGQPARTYVPYVDYGTALAAALGTLAALMHRRRTGEGQHVEASLLGTALVFANSPLAEQAVLARDRVGAGNRGQVYGPADVWRTRDGFVLAQVIGRAGFERWARLMGERGWLEDERFFTDEGRGDHGDVLSERMGRWCAERTTDEALAALAEARLPAGPVLSPQACLDHAQVRALGLWQATAWPGLARPAPVAGLPVRLPHGSAAAPSPAPALGEHTDEVLAGLGYAADEVAAMRRHGVV